jgi:hypothetical protein
VVQNVVVLCAEVDVGVLRELPVEKVARLFQPPMLRNRV